MSMANSALRVAIGGLGTIGMAVARHLDQGIDGLALAAVSARNLETASMRLIGFRNSPSIVTLEQLAEFAEIVVECAPAAVFERVAEPAIRAGRTFVPLSCGALLARPDLIELAKGTGARIVVPTGALLGLDAVRAAAEGHIRSVRMITRKPPAGLIGAPFLTEHDVELENLEVPLKVFDGSARDGAKGFPANVNVAAALSLAGVGADETRLEIWADPELTRNVHHIEVDADSASFSMTIENIPSEENQRTGRITALSVIACLRGLTATLKAGS